MPTLGGCLAICLDSLGGAGNHELKISATGFHTYDQVVNLSCGSTTTIKLLASSVTCITLTAAGCNVGITSRPLPGATATINGLTSPCPVTACLSMAGTYPFSIDAPNFVSSTGSITLSADCATPVITGSTSPTLVPATGFHCMACTAHPADAQPDALPDTLHLTDSVYGATTLTWTGPNNWVGTLAASYPGGCGACGANSTIIQYVYNACQLQIGYLSRFGCPSLLGTSFAIIFGGFPPPTSGPFSFTQAIPPCPIAANGIYPVGATITVTP